ncbi:MAG TPA: ATP-binding protein [Anaeromyxobacteraceae bacterium]|nr:ATP-binding protein [Anaeromyxobacteraceae bacterium]
MDLSPDLPASERAPTDIAARLQWLLRLRWVVIPIFVASDVATDLLVGRRAWSGLVAGGALVALNGASALLLARAWGPAALLRWARIESALVVALPASLTLLHGDPSSPLRYAALVGVVGAAVVLPRAIEVALVAAWACAALVLGDLGALGPSAFAPASVARWAVEAGVVATVAFISAYLHALRERAEHGLRCALAGSERARREWETTFDSLEELVVVTDARGAIVRANAAFAAAAGARPRELRGRLLEEALAGHPERWWSALGDGLVEIEDPRLDSTFEVAVRRLEDGVVRVARDVGEGRRLHARLVHADKLAALGVLASGVAHEINNPTASLSGNLGELRRYLHAYESAFSELTAIAMEAGRADRVSALLGRREVAFARKEAQPALTDCLAGAERIRQVVTNLRSLTRRDQAGEPTQLVDLAEVVEAVAKAAASDLRAAQARVEVRDRVAVTGHRGELVEVVLNLVVNAIQARDGERPNLIEVELRREGDAALVRVADTGKGIPPAHMKRLFEPFFTTKPPGEGTGLGLSLARSIVAAHGGSIDVESEPGAGSTFTVRLPAADAEARAAGVPRAAPAPLRPTRLSRT